MGTEGETAPATQTEDAPAEGEEPAAGAPAEGTEPAGNGPADGDADAAKAKEEAEPSEEVKAAAEKYAKATLGLANKTMAAARRAEKRAEEAARQGEKVAEHLRAHQAFVADLKKAPVAALRELGVGDGTVRGFLNWLRDQGSEPAEPPAADAPLTRAEFEKLLGEHLGKREAKTAQEAAVERDKAAVKDALAKDAKRWSRANTRIGRDMLWQSITDYHKQYGAVPDEAVYQLADSVERDLRADFGEGSAPATGENGGTPPGTQAAPPGRNGGKSLTSRQMSGAPALAELSLDPDERRRQVNEELKRAGVL